MRVSSHPASVSTAQAQRLRSYDWLQPDNPAGSQHATEKHKTGQHRGADEERNVAQSVRQKSRSLTNHTQCRAFFLLSL